jgi:hypothetical protein
MKSSIRFAAQLAGSRFCPFTKRAAEIHQAADDDPGARKRYFAQARITCDVTSDLMTLEISHSSASEPLNIFDIGMATKIWEPR